MKRFTDVELPAMHRPRAVAAHEILMAFTNDGDAEAFNEWWEGPGAVLFQEWLDRPDEN